MNFDLRPFLVLWAVLLASVLALIAWRRSVASHEDDSIHLDSRVGVQQSAVTHKLDAIDKWGKTMTVLTVVFGVLIAVAYLYQIWVRTSTTTTIGG